jgi:hypothetical protein
LKEIGFGEREGELGKYSIFNHEGCVTLFKIEG